MMLPREVERLGPELISWLEQSLLGDLSHYSTIDQDLRFDWTNVIQEGHWMKYRGRMLESLSDIVVRDSHENCIAEGWMDFINPSEDEDAEPVVFWLFLSVRIDGTLTKVKSDAHLPSHVWESFTDQQKAVIAASQSKWVQRDPKVQEWKRTGS